MRVFDGGDVVRRSEEQMRMGVYVSEVDVAGIASEVVTSSIGEAGDESGRKPVGDCCCQREWIDGVISERHPSDDGT